MLRIFSSAWEPDICQLSDVYEQSVQHDGVRKFEEFLHYDFFATKGALLAAWEKSGVYVSAVRLEPYKNGYLIAGLETKPSERRKGFAYLLLANVISALKAKGCNVFYSHINHRNHASICVHKKCGFRFCSDCAVFLDGSVSCNYDTYLCDETPH